MAIKIVAIFVACAVDLITCVDLPFNESQHVFADTDKCRIAVADLIDREMEYRKKYNLSYPIVMGKCKWWLDDENWKQNYKSK